MPSDRDEKSVEYSTLALEDVMAWLYASEINCGIASFWDGGFTLFLGDDMNGRTWEITIAAAELSTAGNLLTLAAFSLYPQSAFVKTLGFGRDPVNEKLGWRGKSPSHADMFQCEFCGAENLDCTLTEHAPGCLIPQARAAIAKADGC